MASAGQAQAQEGSLVPLSVSYSYIQGLSLLENLLKRQNMLFLRHGSLQNAIWIVRLLRVSARGEGAIFCGKADMRRVGLIINIDWPDQHHMGIVAGVQRYAAEQEQWECNLAPQLSDSLCIPGSRLRYDGIIARITPGTRWAETARKVGLPLVNVRLQPLVRDTTTLVPDRRESGCLAAEHLIARGFRHFGYFGFGRDENSRQQVSGFCSTLKAAGFEPDIHLCRTSFDESSGTWERFVEETDRWIETWPRPMGILATSDRLCRYLADFCRGKGLDIPNDVGLIGTQNEPMMCLQPAPSLTSIDMAYDRVGYEAARLLDSMMDGHKPLSHFMTVPPRGLVARQSTDAMAVEDPLVAQAMRFISERGHTGIDVAAVAEAVCTTRRTLERRFRAVLDRTIAEELTRQKIECVKRLLTDTDTPIKALALESGFVDAKQLAKTFKRLAGISPTEYRQQRQSNPVRFRTDSVDGS